MHAHLRPDDGAPLVLLRLLHHELGALRLLRGHLLGLDGRRELAAEGEVGDGHVVERDVEAGRALLQDAPDLTAHDLRAEGGGGGEEGGREGGRRENSRERGSRIKRKGSPEMGREKGSAFSNTAQCRS